ncbi:response regulator [Pseudozobellia sp. WGM2]|uniref:response regulator n=1 Tax=Pseudozobellia sp. WGM2 TaxID=2787625 RepID=UPI001AE0D063|nr:response regulator [Pseudozobellia sp. WGM2]
MNLADKRRNIKILILEDFKEDAELIRRELENGGFFITSRVVDDKDSFLVHLENFQPDLILSDYKLPTFSGLEALMLTTEFDEEIPFVFVTGTVGEEIAAETILNGASGFVLKSNLSKLVGEVERIFSNNEEAWYNKRLKRTNRKIEARISTNQELLSKINQFLNQNNNKESLEDRELKDAIKKFLK